MVSDEAAPHVQHLYRYKNVAQFKADIDFFLTHYQPISLNDILADLHHDRPLPKRCFLVSFDDGLREMADVVAPILKAKGVPAVFFVNSAFVDNRELCFHHKTSLFLDRLLSNSNPALIQKLSDALMASERNTVGIVHRLRQIKYANRAILDRLATLCDLSFQQFLTEQRPCLSSDQIRSLLRNGFDIGAHSVDHPFYGDLPLEEQFRQTRDSIKFLQERFGVKQKAFAFPHSDFGVPRAFFEKMFSERTVDISFGTAGLLPDERHGHFQRFSMEKNAGSACQVIAWQAVRRCGRSIFKRNGFTQMPPSNLESHFFVASSVNG